MKPNKDASKHKNGKAMHFFKGGKLVCKQTSLYPLAITDLKTRVTCGYCLKVIEERKL